MEHDQTFLTQKAMLAAFGIERKDTLHEGVLGANDAEYAQMETVAENVALSDDEKLTRLKQAKGGSWYDGWRPYCLTCSTIDRMTSTEYGFECHSCKNKVGFNLTRLKESPLNQREDNA